MTKLFLSYRWKRRLTAMPCFVALQGAIETRLFDALLAAASRRSPEDAAAFGASLLPMITMRSEKSRTMRRTLEIALPERSIAEIKSIVRRCWANIGAVIGEYPHLGTICDPTSGRLEGRFADLPPGRVPDRPCVFAVGHIANWEVSGAAAANLGMPITAVYKKISNPGVDARILEMRRAMGIDLLAKDDRIVRKLMRTLHDGGSVGIVCDHRDDEGAMIPFFGYPKGTTLAPARLALKTGAQLRTGIVERVGPARYKATASAPIEPDPACRDDQERAISMMRQVNEAFERAIRLRPDHWLCTKRPWPKVFFGTRDDLRKPASTRTVAPMAPPTTQSSGEG